MALQHALSLARHPKRARGRVTKPAVVGPVIDPRSCLNLLDAESILLVKQGYQELAVTFAIANKPLPANRPFKGSSELLLRRLDCAVMEHVYALRAEKGQPLFDSARAAFIEGDPLYESAGLHEQAHIQVCVRDTQRIKGCFRVLPDTATAKD